MYGRDEHMRRSSTRTSHLGLVPQPAAATTPMPPGPDVDPHPGVEFGPCPVQLRGRFRPGPPDSILAIGPGHDRQPLPQAATDSRSSLEKDEFQGLRFLPVLQKRDSSSLRLGVTTFPVGQVWRRSKCSGT
jgi:hypothetical protein